MLAALCISIKASSKEKLYVLNILIIFSISGSQGWDDFGKFYELRDLELSAHITSAEKARKTKQKPPLLPLWKRFLIKTMLRNQLHILHNMYSCHK